MRMPQGLPLTDVGSSAGEALLSPIPGIDFMGFLDPDDQRWTKLLEKIPHDFYHLPRYVSLAGRHEATRPTAFYAESGDSAMLLPLLIRRLPPQLGAPNHWCDLTSPYGYPSPLFHPGSGEYSPCFFLEALHAAARGIDAVCGFFRLHPLLPVPLEHFARRGKLVYHGQTVIIDLKLSNEEIWRNTRENHRENILRLKQEGFTAVMDDWSRLSDFISNYHDTMNRIKAGSCYCFPDSYFEEFRSALGSRAHLVSILSPTGDVTASGLLTTMDGIVQFHLAATASSYLEKAPSKLMFDAVRRWAQEQGERYLHLGGGVGCRPDSLFRFKAGFSRSRADFHTFRMIFHQDRYEHLLRRWQGSASGFEGEADDFFPLYRK